MRTTTSLAAGFSSGTSSSLRTSGPPNSLTRIALMRLPRFDSTGVGRLRRILRRRGRIAAVVAKYGPETGVHATQHATVKVFENAEQEERHQSSEHPELGTRRNLCLRFPAEKTARDFKTNQHG